MQKEDHVEEWQNDSQEAVSLGARSRKEWDEGHTEELETFLQSSTSAHTKAKSKPTLNP